MLSFSEIQLSDEELETLRRLDEKFRQEKPDGIMTADLPQKHVLRFRTLKFAMLFPTETPPNITLITDRGHDYLMYWDGVLAQRKIQTRRFWIATLISIAALIISVIALLANIGLLQLPKVGQSTEESIQASSHEKTEQRLDPSASPLSVHLTSGEATPAVPLPLASPLE